MKLYLNLLTVSFVIMFTGCGDKSPTAQQPKSAAEPGTPSPILAGSLTAPSAPTEQQLTEFLRRSYAGSRLLPDHVIVTRTPFSIVASAAPVFTLQGTIELEALEAGFVQAGAVVNGSGKRFALTRLVLAKGAVPSVPFTMQVTLVAGVLSGTAPALGRNREDFGLPATQFVNPVDIGTDVGKRLRDAPKKIADGELAIELAKSSVRKINLDILKAALDSNSFLLDAAGAIKYLYVDSDLVDKCWQMERPRAQQLLREFLAPRFKGDYERFYSQYNESVRKLVEEKKFIEEL